MRKNLGTFVSTVCLALLAIASHTPAANAAPPRWRRLAKGFEYLNWTVERYDSVTGRGFCRQGKPVVTVLRIDPELYSFDACYYTMYGKDAEPMKAEDWRERLDASAVVNAGQCAPDLSYLGLLVNSQWRFSTKLDTPARQGIFVAEPRNSDLPKARIIDLAYNSFRLDSTSYTQVAEAAMLFDATGRKRVKKGNWTGNRSAIAEDSQGRILVLVTEGAYTLWDFAQMLQASPFDLIQAIELDDGYRSALSVRFGGVNCATLGQWETGDYGDVSLPGMKGNLPAVIGIAPRY